jgi:parallel beta-helix repeat protein
VNVKREVMSSLSALFLGAALLPGLAAEPTLPGSPVLTVDYGQIAWTGAPLATAYDVVRGDLNALRQSGGDFTAATRLCMADDTASLTLPYTGVPNPGEGYWFVVRPVTSTEIGTYDSDGPEQVDSRDSEIEAAPAACSSPVVARPPIAINGNTGFTAANGVVGGTGTTADPYLISGWDIACPSKNGTRGIEVANTTAPFIIRNVKVRGCQNGVLLIGGQNGRVERAMVNDVLNGVGMSDFTNARIEGCRVNLALSSGLGTFRATSILMKGNRIENGQVGIYVNECSGCSVYGNDLLGNDTQGIQAGFYGVLPNTWDSGYPGGGNYWSDYTGVDLCRGPGQDDCTAPDGIGDEKVFVNCCDGDRYPSMIPAFADSDDVPPTVAITSPEPFSEVVTDPFTVSGTAADTGSGVSRVEVTLNGGPWLVAAGTNVWSLQVSPVGGTNTLLARSRDYAGNASSAQSLSVSYEAPSWQAVVQTSVAPAGTTNITFRLTNLTTHAVTLHFPTSCQAFFRVEDQSGFRVYDSLAHASCFQTFTQRTWQSNETVTYNFAWHQVDDNGTPVPPGTYRIFGYMDSTETVPEGMATVLLSP